MTVAAVAFAAVTAGMVAIDLWDPGWGVDQPHRAAATGPRPASGQPRWAAPARHWVGLTEDWNTDGGWNFGDAALASDGTRFVTVHTPQEIGLNDDTSRITGYDGATGKRLWNKGLPWQEQAGPVAGSGVVIIPTASASRVTYVALDTATGKERWRVVSGAPEQNVPAPQAGRAQPAGVLRDGVFYYADGSRVAGVDAATGKPRYRFTSPRYAVTAAVAAGGRIAVIGSRADGSGQALLVLPPDLATYRAIPLGGASAHAVHRLAASGDVLAAWSDGGFWTADARTVRPLVPNQATPAGHVVEGVLGRTIVSADTRHAGAATAFDLLTGRRRWSVDAPHERGAADGFDVADGTLFALGNRVTILAPENGRAVFARRSHSSSDDHRRNDAPEGPGGLVAPVAGHLVVYDPLAITGYR